MRRTLLKNFGFIPLSVKKNPSQQSFDYLITVILKRRIIFITLKYYVFIDPERGKNVNNFITRLSREPFFSHALSAYFLFRLTPRASFQI